MSFYNYLSQIMPIKRMLISLAVGMVSFFIVLISGLTSDFVRTETVVSRTFSAFCFTSLVTFILFMSCEEYGIYKTKRELEDLIDNAQEQVTDEDFDRDEYFRDDDEPTDDVDEEYPEDFRPLQFEDFSHR